LRADLVNMNDNTNSTLNTMFNKWDSFDDYGTVQESKGDVTG